MNPASSKPLQIQVPGILKSHGGEAEAVSLHILDQLIPIGKIVNIVLTAVAVDGAAVP